MELRFNKGDLEILKSLKDDELAATFEYLYGSACFLKGCTNFRQTHRDIVDDAVELSESVARQIKKRANLKPTNCYLNFHTSYTPEVRKWLISKEKPTDFAIPDFSFNSALKNYIRKASYL